MNTFVFNLRYKLHTTHLLFLCVSISNFNPFHCNAIQIIITTGCLYNVKSASYHMCRTDSIHNSPLCYCCLPPQVYYLALCYCCLPPQVYYLEVTYCHQYQPFLSSRPTSQCALARVVDIEGGVLM